jgi:hypothetical protein
MSGGTQPPLRFLILVIGGWSCLRAALLIPAWWVDEGEAAPAAGGEALRAATRAGDDDLREPATPRIATAFAPNGSGRTAAARRALGALRSVDPPSLPAVGSMTSLLPLRTEPSSRGEGAPWPVAVSPVHRVTSGRWSGSGWLLLRSDEGDALAPGGTLGASQAGVRLLWRVAGDPRHPLALAARLYAPVSHRAGAEVALGLDWRPLAVLPLHVVAERRQALGRDGRSAFALALYGGISRWPLTGRLRLEAFGQAGVVGARSRDLFADGSARLSVPAGRLELGAGLWGGAQPGAARLDAGPQIGARLPFAGERVRVSAEWRFRIAGDARPDSGPALTVGTDF